MSARVLVLGSTGMLGSAVFGELQGAGLNPLSASRTSGVMFDATKPDVDRLFARAQLGVGDYVVNCVGLTKARIDESSAESRMLAVALNVYFPHALAMTAEKYGVKVIQVATDCVYSGARGAYVESDSHDPLDVYGKTKSLGEIPSKSVMHLRCSLIGPEVGRNSLFFEWLRQLPRGSSIDGYTNHIWNGLSSDAFGKIVAGIIRQEAFSQGVQHLVPADIVTKDERVRLVLEYLDRSDVIVNSAPAERPVNRTLSTDTSEKNEFLFRGAGYSNVPTIRDMVRETCLQLAN